MNVTRPPTIFTGQPIPSTLSSPLLGTTQSLGLPQRALSSAPPVFGTGLSPAGSRAPLGSYLPPVQRSPVLGGLPLAVGPASFRPSGLAQAASLPRTVLPSVRSPLRASQLPVLGPSLGRTLSPAPQLRQPSPPKHVVTSVRRSPSPSRTIARVSPVASLSPPRSPLRTLQTVASAVPLLQQPPVSPLRQPMSQQELSMSITPGLRNFLLARGLTDSYINSAIAKGRLREIYDIAVKNMYLMDIATLGFNNAGLINQTVDALRASREYAFERAILFRIIAATKLQPWQGYDRASNQELAQALRNAARAGGWNFDTYYNQVRGNGLQQAHAFDVPSRSPSSRKRSPSPRRRR